jgi:hypothetical protein
MKATITSYVSRAARAAAMKRNVNRRNSTLLQRISRMAVESRAVLGPESGNPVRASAADRRGFAGRAE